MTRICECGCQQPVEGRGRFLDASHRARAWRSSHVKAGPVDHPRAGANARSGSQISYAKAVEVLARWLALQAPGTLDDARKTAQLLLRGALSEQQAERERQRERS